MHFDDKKVIVVGGSGDRRTPALAYDLAIELAEHKIRVNAIAPVAVNTSALKRWIPKGEIDSTLGTFAPLHPLGRVGTTVAGRN
jgi:NAD(P)-dependent dehydrogenase (short-subunit alcohol dehydrogenase family)